MFQKILVPVDLADPDFVKPALDKAVEMAKASGGAVRLINVIPMTPVMLAEYVPPDFDVQQRGSAEEALGIVANESGLSPDKVSTVVRQGGIYHEVLEEAKSFAADIIVERRGTTKEETMGATLSEASRPRALTMPFSSSSRLWKSKKNEARFGTTGPLKVPP